MNLTGLSREAVEEYAHCLEQQIEELEKQVSLLDAGQRPASDMVSPGRSALGSTAPRRPQQGAGGEGWVAATTAAGWQVFGW